MKQGKNANINKGAALLSIVFVLLFFVLIVRFAYVEITKQVDGQELKNIAQRNWQVHEDNRADRGSILDAGGKTLAKDVNAYTVFAVLSKKARPDYVTNPQKTAAKLAPILHMDKARLTELLSKDRFQVELGPKAKRISYQKKEKIDQLNLPGIHFRSLSKRYYPNQTFASYLLGFTKRKNHTTEQGVMGIEKVMNDKLTGKDGSTTYQASPNGVKLPGTNESKEAPQDGDNVYLTIDHHIQTFLEHAMTKVNKKYEPHRMMAIVTEPKTGKILAIANRPTFNPNKRDTDRFTNSVVSDAYEPGSTMKILTLSAAVDAGVYPGKEKFKSGTYKVGGGTIHDWNNGTGFGKITYNEGVRRSSNVAFARLAKEKIGFDRFHDYLEKFDISKKTGIAMPNEASGQLQYDIPIEKATTAFGQGSTVTPLQQVKAASAIANDGKMMKPYIIDKAVDPNNDHVDVKNKPKVAGEPISADSAKKVRDLLGTVVTGEHGTGKDFAIKGYKVAGKTGTAQIPKKNGSGYMKDGYIHSFIGMAPKDDPKLMMYVAVDRPDVDSWHEGSKPVAQIFRPVMKNSMQYLSVKPAKNKKSATKTTIADYSGQNMKKAKKSLEKQGFHALTLGSGKTVLDQQPVPDTPLFEGERVILNSGGKIKMPDMTGWSFADVMKFAQLLHLKPDIHGTGYVTKQSIPPGDQVKKGDEITINLSSEGNKKKS